MKSSNNVSHLKTVPLKENEWNNISVVWNDHWTQREECALLQGRKMMILRPIKIWVMITEGFLSYGSNIFYFSMWSVLLWNNYTFLWINDRYVDINVAWKHIVTCSMAIVCCFRTMTYDWRDYGEQTYCKILSVRKPVCPRNFGVHGWNESFCFALLCSALLQWPRLPRIFIPLLHLTLIHFNRQFNGCFC